MCEAQSANGVLEDQWFAGFNGARGGKVRQRLPMLPGSLIAGIDFALLHIEVESRHEGGGASRA
jgi:hypothetical protein